ncbi:MAG: hypothetical protein K9N55_18945 [Phycisphaerae bacterium]|nr:hypothetical protein [Phycisphaerae bacterium]
MSENNREIHDLLMDYAGALRDGCIPDFLKSLTRNEANTIQESYELPEATEMIRLLNGASFADAAVSPNVGLFIARVDAKITSRKKQASAARRTTRKRQSRLYEIE